MMIPLYSSSTSITTSSIGSSFLPPSSLNNTRGRDTESSKPSLLIFSINTPSCNSPRPPTSNASPLGAKVTVIATFVSASAYKRSFIAVEVSFVPSCPAKGESLTLRVIAIVGGSTGVELTAVVTSGAAIVSETEASSSPAIAIMSPATACSTGMRFKPENESNLVNLPRSITLPSRSSTLRSELTFAMP